MREIKFRQPITKGGKFIGWHYWGYVGNDLGFFTSPLSSNDGKIETSYQITGLLDKQGKEIYEGDIVDVPHKLMKKYRWKVVFYKGAFVLSDGIGFRHLYSEKYSQKYEVIGNIYENPELLD